MFNCVLRPPVNYILIVSSHNKNYVTRWKTGRKWRGKDNHTTQHYVNGLRVVTRCDQEQYLIRSWEHETGDITDSDLFDQRIRWYFLPPSSDFLREFLQQIKCYHFCVHLQNCYFFSFQNASELATTCSNGINLHITLLTILGNLLLSFELDINNYYSNSILQHIITRFYCYPYGVQKEKRIWHWFRSIAMIVRSYL